MDRHTEAGYFQYWGKAGKEYEEMVDVPFEHLPYDL